MGKPVSHLEWFDVADPHSAELDELARRFGLHELQIEDCRDRHQRAKTEDHDHYNFTIAKHIHQEGKLSFDDIDLFLGPDFLISVRTGDAAFMDHVFKRVEQERVDRLDRVFYMILDRLVDEYQPVLDRLADDISEIEEVVLERPEPPTLAQIFALRRELVDFRRMASSMREVINALMRREQGLLGARPRSVFSRRLRSHRPDRGHDRDLSRPVVRRAGHLPVRGEQSDKRSHEGAHHLGHRDVAAGDHHQFLRDEPALALGKRSSRDVVCLRADDGVDRGNTDLLQGETLVLVVNHGLVASLHDAIANACLLSLA